MEASTDDVVGDDLSGGVEGERDEGEDPREEEEEA